MGAEFLHLPDLPDDGLNAAAEQLFWVALFNYLRERSLEGCPDLVEQHLWTCDSIAGHGQLLFPNLAFSQDHEERQETPYCQASHHYGKF